MKIEHELSTAVREWLRSTRHSPYSAQQTVGEVMRRLSDKGRSRRRRWGLPWRRTRADPPRIDPLGLGPAPFPATDGDTPTVTGRTRIMFSPAKVVTAGALAIAIGGSLLIAQPFDRPGASVPGAATDDPAMAPSFFSGAPDDWLQTVGATARRDDGVVDGTGESFTVTWEASDPRISGTAAMAINETDYREGATTLVPTGHVGSIRTLLLRIVNDDGAWEGPLQFLIMSNPESSNAAGWLTGTGAYEGLSAYLVWPEVLTGSGFHGHITAEGPPPVPVLPAE